MALSPVAVILLAATIHSCKADVHLHGRSNNAVRNFSEVSRVLSLDLPHSSANNDKDADFIIGNAEKLSKNQDETHPLSIHSFTAFPIVTDFFPNTKRTLPMLAGGRLGKGKIIGASDHEFFKLGDPKYKDDQTVLLNALRWLSKDSSSAPKKVGINEYNKDLFTFLKANGIEASRVFLHNLRSVQQLESFDVLFLSFGYVETMVNLEIVSEFIQNGGGAIVLSQANLVNVDEKGPFPENNPLNKLTAPAGFVWTQDYSDGQPQKSDYYTLSKGTPSKTKTALDAVRSLGDRTCSEKDDLDLSFLNYVYGVTPLGIPVYPGTELERMVQDIALRDQPQPSKKKPASATPDNVCRTKRFHGIMTKTFLKTPESVVAHPAAKKYPGIAVSTGTSLVEYYNISLEPLQSFKHRAEIQFNTENWVHGGSIITKETVVTEKNADYWLSTSRYLNAGAKGKITILNRNDDFDQLEVLVGAHTDTLYKETEKKWSRLPVISTTYKFTKGVARFSSPYGGLVYILVPYFLSNQDLDVSTLQLSFEGDFVQAPVYDSDSMDNNAWKAVRNNPAPWAEIGNNRIKFIVSSSRVRNLDDPADLMKFWNEAMDAYSDLLGLPKVFHRPQRFLEEIQVADALMHSGYPIVVDSGEIASALSVEKMKEPRSSGGGAANCWGFFHELGHNFQDDDLWSPVGAEEVTNNIMSTYLCQLVSGVDQAHEHLDPEIYKGDVDEFIHSGKKDWLDGSWAGLQFYLFLQRTYGWGFYKKFFGTFAKNKFEKPKGNVAMMSLSLEIMSSAAGKNLVDYFDSWKIEVSKEAREKVTKTGLPLSGLKVEDILSE